MDVTPAQKVNEVVFLTGLLAPLEGIFIFDLCACLHPFRLSVSQQSPKYLPVPVHTKYVISTTNGLGHGLTLAYPPTTDAASQKGYVASFPQTIDKMQSKPFAGSAVPFGLPFGPNGPHCFLKNGLTCQGDIWHHFTALTLQKVKLSDEPVEAKEDYTKFNRKDLKTEKVCVSSRSGIFLDSVGGPEDIGEWFHAWFWCYNFNHKGLWTCLSMTQ